jgi:hypothetical protein
MKLIKPLLAGLTAMVVAAGFALSAQAVPITGSMTFTGGARFDTNSLATASTVNTFSNTSVLDADGSFTGVSGPVTMSAPWTFAPVPGLARPALWSVGGFTFDLSGTTAVDRPLVGGIQFLVITGVGTLFGPVGFDPTHVTWSFSTQAPSVNGKFSFSAATSAVPDGGMTGTLLGAALIGLAAYRAKFAKPVKA